MESHAQRFVCINEYYVRNTRINLSLKKDIIWSFPAFWHLSYIICYNSFPDTATASKYPEERRFRDSETAILPVNP